MFADERGLEDRRTRSERVRGAPRTGRGGAIPLVIPLALALAGIGCGDPAVGPDDAGSTPDDDAGAPPDAGDRPVDAGPLDAGTPPPDAGHAGDDAGAPTDGGPPPVTFSERELAIIRTLSPLPALAPDPTNAVADDPAAAALGQRLFFDARFSGPLRVASDLGAVGERGRVSCASCHGSEVMSDDRSSLGVSIGAGFHTRNAPAIVDSALYPWTNWGGRFSAQWELPPVVAESPVIMNSTRLEIAHHLFDHYRTEYEAIFGPMEPAIGTDAARFPPAGKPKASASDPDGPWESMTPEDRAIVNRIFINFGKAIQAYMRLLVSGPSAFDRFVAGEDDAIGESAKRGLRLFVGEARCVSCHSGPTLSDGEFHNIGVPRGPDVTARDDGRYKDVPGLLASPFNSAGAFSDDPATGALRLAGLTNPPPEHVRGAFRTPTLRGVTLSAPYMHAGQHATLEEVIEFYDVGGGVPEAGTLDDQMFPLGLTEDEQADLIEFLRALEGEPVPEALRTDPG